MNVGLVAGATPMIFFTDIMKNTPALLLSVLCKRTAGHEESLPFVIKAAIVAQLARTWHPTHEYCFTIATAWFAVIAFTHSLPPHPHICLAGGHLFWGVAPSALVASSASDKSDSSAGTKQHWKFWQISDQELPLPAGRADAPCVVQRVSA